MTLYRTSLTAFSLCLSALFASDALIAEKEQINCEEVCCCEPSHLRLELAHREGGGIGYNQGYSTIGLFYNPFLECATPIVDIRGHVFNNGKWAANCAIGVRKYFDSINYVGGFYLDYDYRNYKHASFNQASAGFEMLGSRWSFRANGYVPFGRKEKVKDTIFEEFSGHHILLAKRSYLSMYGVDGELEGAWSPTCYLDLFLGAGPYYFKGKFGHDAVGGKARVGLSFYQWLNFAGRFSYDTMFHFRAEGEIRLDIPLDKIKGFWKRGKDLKIYCQEDCLSFRLNQLLQRQEIVVISKKQKKIKTARHPGDFDIPYFVWHVDNSASPNGNGTIEDPFNTLAAAQAASGNGDIIFVDTGNETSIGMNAGIVLKDSQKLLGSATVHPLNTSIGLIDIPAFTSVLPRITNTAGHGVTLANSNEIAGFNISATGDAAIFGSGFSIGSLIRDNQLLNFNTTFPPAFGGISLTLTQPVFGTMTIIRNFISSPIDGNRGILIQHSLIPPVPAVVSIDVNIDQNTIINNGQTGILISGGGVGRTMTFTGNITNNLIQGNTSANAGSIQFGTFAAANPVILGLDVVNNKLLNNSGTGGFGFSATSASGFLNMSNNLISGNGSVAADVATTVTVPTNFFLRMIHNENQYLGNAGTNSISITTSAAAGMILLDFMNNTVTKNILFTSVAGTPGSFIVKMEGNTGTLSAPNPFTLITD